MVFQLENFSFLVSMNFQNPTSATTKRAGGIFSTITFLKAVASTDENALQLVSYSENFDPKITLG